MTIAEFCSKHLISNGMFPTDADAVVTAYKASVDANMQQRWSHNIDDYPVVMKAVIILGWEALKWIDNNAPQSWFRCIFVGAA